MPVEVWDIGPTGPFNTNDPADDVQLIVNIFSDSGGECHFGYGEGEMFSRQFSDRIYGYYPTTTYAEYEALMKPLVDSDPNGCPTDPATAEASDLIDFGRGRPIQREVFIDNTGGAKDVADLVGVVVRFLTTKPNLPGDVFTLSTEGLGAQAPDVTTQQARLDEIGIVPNPYKGASSYEVSQLIDQANQNRSGTGGAVELLVPLTARYTALGNATTNAVALESEGIELPTLLNFGASYTRELGAGAAVTVLGNFRSNSFDQDQYSGGLELGFQNIVYVRGGLEVTQDQDLTFFEGYSFGAGLNLELSGTRLTVDYALVPTEFFDDVQYITASVTL